MLSAKKVKVHGMKDTRWTTKDKINQFKGLINLFARDKKVAEADTNVVKRKQIKELKQLQKNIKKGREEFDNAVRGDRQQLRNILAEHKSMQLAYQELHPLEVMGHLHQNNFSQRKERDRLHYKLQQRAEKLVFLKLQVAALEDQKVVDAEVLPIEERAQIITGKVQDAILKKEAALAVKTAYFNILTIMQKDAIFFDSILIAIQSDGANQSKCMISTTELGQLATEYLDDRKQEFKDLERQIKRDMRERQDHLKTVRAQANDLGKSLRFLLRRDSDVNLGKVILSRCPSQEHLEGDIENVEEVLNFLQETTAVPNYDIIFPCLEEQMHQKERLTSLLAKSQNDRDILLNKKNHADLMLSTLINTMVETTGGYVENRGELIQERKNEEERLEHIDETIRQHGKLVAEIRKSLQQILGLCGIVGQKRKSKKEMTTAVSAFYISSDSTQILNQLTNKLTLLTQAATAQLDARRIEEAEKLFEQLTLDIAPAIEIQDGIVEESLVDVFMDDPQVPTRTEIKTKSQEIVEQFTKSEFDLPPPPKKKSKKKAK